MFGITRKPSGLVRPMLAGILAWALGGCSSVHPWINQPLSANAVATPTAVVPPATQVSSNDSDPQALDSSIIGVVALSGGGARAAAFGLGVLRELKATRFEWQGRETSLLDEVDLVSGVSGGSVLAAYYAAFGDQVFERFDHDFLHTNFQSNLIHDLLSPTQLYRLGSPWYGRSNALAQRLDELYEHRSFGDLSKTRGHPELLITATDLTTGAPFEFTAEQFNLICSDLSSVPLSFAVAASSSVPLLLSPVTIRNYAGQCPANQGTDASALQDDNLSAHLIRMIAKSYRNAEARPYLHLVDGGIVDNLGVRGLLNRTIARGSLNERFRGLPPGSIHQLVLVSVDSEKDAAEHIDDTDRIPSNLQVLDSLVFGAGSRLTQETTAMVEDASRRMAQELQADRLIPDSPFARDAEIHVIHVSLKNLRNAELRQRLVNVPTALTILPIQVDELQEAGRTALRESPEFQHLRQSLHAHSDQDAKTAIPEQ